jgi:hypothetical protein
MSARPTPRRFSDELLEAAARVDELPREDVARLLMKAAIRLRVIQQAGAKLEHIPVAAYDLLRQLARHPIKVADLYGRPSQGALDFLISRQLAERSADGAFLMITTAGNELGEIAEEPGPE